MMEGTSRHIENMEKGRQVSIRLDSYDDIFSGFDPRPYSERILSDDFIAELKKISREDEFGIEELQLLMHEKNRKQETEPTIIKRVHTYFRKGNYYLSKRIKNIRKQATLIAIAGMVLILSASYISGIHSGKFYIKILFVLFEPAGWFFVWTGMDDLFFAARKRKEEINFFSKMAKTKVVFTSY